jgi:hypothetical protein
MCVVPSSTVSSLGLVLFGPLVPVTAVCRPSSCLTNSLELILIFLFPCSVCVSSPTRASWFIGAGFSLTIFVCRDRSSAQVRGPTLSSPHFPLCDPGLSLLLRDLILAPPRFFFVAPFSWPGLVILLSVFVRFS